nr:phospholipase-like protein [Tanacetum cinerariifolium]
MFVVSMLQIRFRHDNPKAVSVCDDIDEPDAAADDNAKATSVHDDHGVPDVAANDSAKATSVCDDIDEADATANDNAKEVVSAADNGEVVKETQLLDSHENEEGDSIIRLPLVNGNYLKEIHLARWEEVVELWVQLMWHLRPKHADWAISSPYYCNLRTPNDLEDWILKDITYPVGWANVEMVYIPKNILGIHWFLAVFKIRNAVVTFYDTLSNKKP